MQDEPEHSCEQRSQEAYEVNFLAELSRERDARELAEVELRRLIEESQKTVLCFVASLELESAALRSRIEHDASTRVAAMDGCAAKNEASRKELRDEFSALVAGLEDRFSEFQKELVACASPVENPVAINAAPPPTSEMIGVIKEPLSESHVDKSREEYLAELQKKLVSRASPMVNQTVINAMPRRNVDVVDLTTEPRCASVVSESVEARVQPPLSARLPATTTARSEVKTSETAAQMLLEFDAEFAARSAIVSPVSHSISAPNEHTWPISLGSSWHPLGSLVAGSSTKSPVPSPEKLSTPVARHLSGSQLSGAGNLQGNQLSRSHGVGFNSVGGASWQTAAFNAGVGISQPPAAGQPLQPRSHGSSFRSASGAGCLTMVPQTSPPLSATCPLSASPLRLASQQVPQLGQPHSATPPTGAAPLGFATPPCPRGRWAAETRRNSVPFPPAGMNSPPQGWSPSSASTRSPFMFTTAKNRASSDGPLVMRSTLGMLPAPTVFHDVDAMMRKLPQIPSLMPQTSSSPTLQHNSSDVDVGEEATLSTSRTPLMTRHRSVPSTTRGV